MKYLFMLSILLSANYLHSYSINYVENTIEIVSEGQLKTKANMAIIEIVLFNKKMGIKRALQKINKSYHKFIKVINENEIDESFINEKDLKINGNISKKTKKGRLKEIHTEKRFEIIYKPLKDIESFLFDLMKIKGLYIKSIEFTHENLDSLRIECYESALEKSKHLAHKISKAMNLIIEKPIYITNSEFRDLRPSFKPVSIKMLKHKLPFSLSDTSLVKEVDEIKMEDEFRIIFEMKNKYLVIKDKIKVIYKYKNK